METPGQEWTGERLITSVFSENTFEHLHRYALAVSLAAGKHVLDIACGEGYGSNLIAATASSVTGVDIDAPTVALAAKKYQLPNLKYMTGSADAIPCAAASIDLVVSFETLEHHNKHEEMLLEICRVLKPGGQLLISSPDKKYYSDVPGYNNPFHVRELYKEEFEGLIKKHFTHTRFYNQRATTGSMIWPDNEAGTSGMGFLGGDYQSVGASALYPVYNIAFASDQALPSLPNSFFNGEDITARQLHEAYLAREKAMKESWSFRIGSTLLKPFSAIKKLFNA